MKTIALSAIAIILAISITSAQTNQPPTPKNYNSWLFPIKGYGDSTAVAYYTGRVDTLAATYHSTAKYVTGYFRNAAASIITLTVDVSDTGNVKVEVKTRTRSAGYGAASSWSAILTDSLVNTGASASSGLVKEFSLKDGDSDLFDAVDQEYMVILTHSAWGSNDTQGTARRRVRINWK